MILDKMGKHWAKIAAFLFYSLTISGFFVFYTEMRLGEIVTPDRWFSLTIIVVLTCFFGGIYFFSEEGS